jgi:hypothetical protein
LDQITVENISPLDQRQKVLLLDAGYAPDAQELTETWNFVLRGELSEAKFAAAWEEVCKRHRVLCTTLIWKRVERPLQIAQRQARLPLNYYDWRVLAPAAQVAEFVKLIRQEEEQGFNFAQPPLVRLSLCRTAEDVYQVICSYSALLFDRRSIALLFKEVLRTYGGQVVTGELDHESEDQAYQLSDADYSSARDWWTRTLADFQPTTLTTSRVEQAPEGFYGETELKLGQTLTASLRRTAFNLDISLDALVRSAWAVVLANYTGTERVTFGVDTLPLQVEVENSNTVSEWLRKQEAEWVQLSRWAQVPAALIRQWGKLDANARLFESHLVFPWAKQAKASLIVERARAFALHETPLLIEIVSREPLTVRATYTTQLLDSAATVRLLRHFEQALVSLHMAPQTFDASTLEIRMPAVITSSTRPQ